MSLERWYKWKGKVICDKDIDSIPCGYNSKCDVCKEPHPWQEYGFSSVCACLWTRSFSVQWKCTQFTIIWFLANVCLLMHEWAWFLCKSKPTKFTIWFLISGSLIFVKKFRMLHKNIVYCQSVFWLCRGTRFLRERLKHYTWI